MNTELATTQPSQMMPPPAPMEVDETGLSDFIKMKPSRLALIQHTSTKPQGANPGQILDDESGQVYDSIPLVLLKMHTARVFFKPGAPIAKGTEPLCRSWDGKVPAQDVLVRQSSTCASCPRAVWQGKTAPPCKEKLELAVATVDDVMPHYFSVGGKSISPVRKVLDTISKALKNKTLASLHHAVLTFRGVKDKTTYMLEVVKPSKDASFDVLTDEQASPFISLFKEMKSQSNQQDVLDAEFAADDAVGEILTGEILPTVHQQV